MKMLLSDVQPQARSGRSTSRPLHSRLWIRTLLAGAVLSALFIPLASSFLVWRHAHAASDNTIDSVVCGDSVNFSQLDLPNQYDGQYNWVSVTGGTFNRPNGDGSTTPVQLLGDTENGKCTGHYHWGWNQTDHTAVWKYQQIGSIPKAGQSMCSVDVYIGPWFFGADTQYNLSINGGSQIETFDQFFQRYSLWQIYQNSGDASVLTQGGWYPLTVQSQHWFSLTAARDNNNAYNFVLVLTRGNDNSQWLYLGADAARFICS